jgi:2-(1,2-epoxy-1,2-dihydrophenyl)acetyl-CoA isomerase
MNKGLAETLAWAELDPVVGCIVLTGAGEAFCGGGDVSAMGDGSTLLDPAQRIASRRVNQRATVGRLFQMPKPTIAALPGAAAGAGMSYALACDFRVMSDKAFMTTAFAKIALSGDYGSSFFLTHLVGAARARELLFLSDRISAEEAGRLGLANIVCQPEELLARTRALAARLSQGPRVAYRYMKENLNRAISADLDACLDLEATNNSQCRETADHLEATRAFREKRSPIFRGA